MGREERLRTHLVTRGVRHVGIERAFCWTLRRGLPWVRRRSQPTTVEQPDPVRAKASHHVDNRRLTAESPGERIVAGEVPDRVVGQIELDGLLVRSVVERPVEGLNRLSIPPRRSQCPEQQSDDCDEQTGGKDGHRDPPLTPRRLIPCAPQDGDQPYLHLHTQASRTFRSARKPSRIPVPKLAVMNTIPKTTIHHWSRPAATDPRAAPKITQSGVGR